MSRRRRPPADQASVESWPKVQLVCTGRGHHKRTHLGWCDVSRAEDRPRTASEPFEDWLFFSIDKDDVAGAELQDYARATIDLETGEVYEGDDRSRNLLKQIRVRFTPGRLCDRCRMDGQLTEARLAALVRHAQDEGVLALDVSRLR